MLALSQDRATIAGVIKRSFSTSGIMTHSLPRERWAHSTVQTRCLTCCTCSMSDPRPRPATGEFQPVATARSRHVPDISDVTDLRRRRCPIFLTGLLAHLLSSALLRTSQHLVPGFIVGKCLHKEDVMEVSAMSPGVHKQPTSAQLPGQC